MAITRNAKKALRASNRKREANDILRRTLKETVKTVRKDITAKDAKAIKADLSLAYKALDKAAKKGVIKKSTAARRKSRLSKAIAKIEK